MILAFFTTAEFVEHDFLYLIDARPIEKHRKVCKTNRIHTAATDRLLICSKLGLSSGFSLTMK